MLEFSLASLQIIVSTRQEGSFRLAAEKVVATLKKDYGRILPEKANFHHLYLNHSAKLIGATSSEEQTLQVSQGDALLSEEKANSFVFSMVVGDCFPIIFFDQKTKKVALIHASRRTLFLGILQKTFKKFALQSDFKPKNLRVWIGPGIGVDSYILNFEPDENSDQSWQRFIKKFAGDWQIDLPGVIDWQLTSLGIAKEQITDLQIDTYKERQRFYSHRRAIIDGDEDGRFLVAVFFPK